MTAFDCGFDEYTAMPDLLLVEVWRVASTMTANRVDAHAYVEGYQAARRQRDEAAEED